ncbi:MAG: DnaA regulatory inactivator Hda [Hahellaceae bacterium]|nr:DnaA regulatory inactivator Hda [Hahellaceae bacterium]
MDNKPHDNDVQQLALPLRLMAGASFDNFFGESNRKPVAILEQMLTQRRDFFSYVYGPEGTGKTHLLCAACQFSGSGLRVIYLPLRDVTGNLADCLQGVEDFDLVCIDDIDKVAGHRDHEVALFNLYNRLKDAGHQLIVSAQVPPAALRVVMPDLLSRLSWGVVLPLKELDDQEKSEALKRRAAETGVELADEVISFIMRRSNRTLHELFDLFERLDEAAYKAQRRITVPFVKEILGW